MNSAHALTDGLSAYAGVLAHAGGRELEARVRGGDDAAPAVAIYASPPYDMDVPALAVARLSINLSHAHVTGGLDGDRPRAYVARRHTLFYTPAGVGAHWRKEQPSRHINIYFDDRGRAAAPLLNATLPGLRPLLEMLAAELTGGAAYAAEAVDSLARLVLVRLMRRAARSGSNPVTPAVMARLREFVLAHLDQRLLVADLAAAVALPAYRFAQAFAASSGCSPHQFVIERRVEHAAELLRGSRQPLADIAARCGFASQQHLTQVMRRRLGTTPARYRTGCV